MLKRLTIENLVLVDCETVVFQEGFNVLSGETGAGKSALMGALGLALGDKCDASLIRRGATRAIVEAVFAKPVAAVWQELMEQEGLETDLSDEVTLRRELSSNGRSRAFLNEQLVTLSFLKELSPYLVKRIGQEATYKLRSPELQRELLDRYAASETALRNFQQSYEQERSIEEELQALLVDSDRRERERIACEEDLEEIRNVNLRDDEEKEIFDEYTLLSNTEAIVEKVNRLCQEIDESDHSLLSRMRYLNPGMDSLVALDSSFEAIAVNFKDVLLNLQDISYALRERLDISEGSSERMEELSLRLAAINRLKRKYGRTVAEIQEREAVLESRLQICLDADVQIRKLELRLKELKKDTEHWAAILTDKRDVSCQLFQEAVQQEIRLLNMPKADFQVRISKSKRSSYGDEKIEYFLAPNPGEPMVSVAESVSGGELARLLLSIKVVLAAKEPPSTLLFDEIDAHIGGETAAAVGKKLRQLGAAHQVLCITHFAQVAVQAHTHLKITKNEIVGRTRTSINPLIGHERQSEIVRMTGGEAALLL